MSDEQPAPATSEEKPADGSETAALPTDASEALAEKTLANDPPEAPAPDLEPEPEPEPEAPKADDEAQPTRHSKRTAG